MVIRVRQRKYVFGYARSGLLKAIRAQGHGRIACPQRACTMFIWFWKIKSPCAFPRSSVHTLLAVISRRLKEQKRMRWPISVRKVNMQRRARKSFILSSMARFKEHKANVQILRRLKHYWTKVKLRRKFLKKVFHIGVMINSFVMSTSRGCMIKHRSSAPSEYTI